MSNVLKMDNDNLSEYETVFGSDALNKWNTSMNRVESEIRNVVETIAKNNVILTALNEEKQKLTKEVFDLTQSIQTYKEIIDHNTNSKYVDSEKIIELRQKLSNAVSQMKKVQEKSLSIEKAIDEVISKTNEQTNILGLAGMNKQTTTAAGSFFVGGYHRPGKSKRLESGENVLSSTLYTMMRKRYKLVNGRSAPDEHNFCPSGHGYIKFKWKEKPYTVSIPGGWKTVKMVHNPYTYKGEKRNEKGDEECLLYKDVLKCKKFSDYVCQNLSNVQPSIDDISQKLEQVRKKVKLE